MVFKRQDAIAGWLVSLVNQCFYVTWIAVRIFIYPAILMEFLRLAVERVTETGVYFHWEMIMIAVHGFLCVLNLKWSYDLFAPIVKVWIGSGKEVGVATGL